MGHSRTPTYSAAGDGFPAEPIVGSGIDGKLSLLVKSFLNQLARRWAAPSAGAVGAAHLQDRCEVTLPWKQFSEERFVLTFSRT